MSIKIYNLSSQKGAASIFLVMAVLAAVLAIALGSSFIVATETRSSLDSGESVAAYYAAESGMEKAMYEKIKLGREPQVNRCAGNCPSPACVWEDGWACTETVLSSANPYCIEITEVTDCDPYSITSIKSIGEYKTTRRSIELSF